RELFRHQRPEDMLVVSLARFMQLQHEPDSAIEAEFRSNLGQNPAMSSSRVELLQMLIVARRPDDALKVADEAMALLPIPAVRNARTQEAAHDAGVARRVAAFVNFQL